MAWQPVLTLLLIAVLTLAGAGRGLDARAAEQPIQSIPGVVAPICHTGGTAAPSPGDPDPAHHDCCDVCALCGSVALIDTPGLIAPDRIERFASHKAALAWSPSLARPRTPRLSQGPPAA